MLNPALLDAEPSSLIWTKSQLHLIPPHCLELDWMLNDENRKETFAFSEGFIIHVQEELAGYGPRKLGLVMVPSSSISSSLL